MFTLRLIASSDQYGKPALKSKAALRDTTRGFCVHTNCSDHHNFLFGANYLLYTCSLRHYDNKSHKKIKSAKSANHCNKARRKKIRNGYSDTASGRGPELSLPLNIIPVVSLPQSNIESETKMVHEDVANEMASLSIKDPQQQQQNAPTNRAQQSSSAKPQRLRVNVHAPTNYGESLVITGTCEELSCETGVSLRWKDGGRWVGEWVIGNGLVGVKVKFGIKKDDGGEKGLVKWEWDWRQVGVDGFGEMVGGWVVGGAVRVSDEGKFVKEVFGSKALRGIVFGRDFGNGDLVGGVVNKTEERIVVERVLIEGRHVVGVRFGVFAERVLKGDAVCIEFEDGAMVGDESESGVVPMSEGMDGMWWKTVAIKRKDDGCIKWRFLIKNKKSDHVLVQEDEWREFVVDEEDMRFINEHVGSTAVVIAEAKSELRYPRKWKGSGIAIPVFALRSSTGCGVGEFKDLKSAVDLCVASGYQLLQLLPINDTTVYNDFRDTYPYSANSSFALHPQFLNIESVGQMPPTLLKEFEQEKLKLNSVPEIQYRKMMAVKMKYLRIMYNMYKDEFLASREFAKWFEPNKHWLVPYAVFRFLMEVNGSANFDKWGARTTVTLDDLEALSAKDTFHFDYVGLAYFIQFHSHKQLSQAAEYATKHGVIFKGDLPIGVNRYCVDTWINPHLFRLHVQAGAPPDYFSEFGQNWFFPTYDWDAMRKENYAWWRARLGQMAKYFHAYRVDHVLGFFRIWEIPSTSLTGMSGRFHPVKAIHKSELDVRGIWDIDRIVMPYVKDGHLQYSFGENWWKVKERFFEHMHDRLKFKEEYSTEKKIAEALELPNDASDAAKAENERLKNGLFHLQNNVCFFRDLEDPNLFHPRFRLQSTSSYQELGSAEWKYIIEQLYQDYFFKRQDDLWRKNGREKLPMLQSASDMLVCAEDLGMIPDCVPDVLTEASIIGLRVQRMPESDDDDFGVPTDYPYDTVATTSSHDTSTFRGWWEEIGPDHRRKYWHEILKKGGEPSAECNPDIIEAAIEDHLKCPSMWAIFPLQDLMGMDGEIRRPNAKEEQINDPSNSRHVWNFRLHMDIEKLISKKDFITKLRSLNDAAGRGHAY